MAAAVAAERGLRVRYLLCTHAHGDHFSRRTLRHMRDRVPAAEPLAVGTAGPPSATADGPGERPV